MAYRWWSVPNRTQRKKRQKLCEGEVLPLDKSLLMGDSSDASFQRAVMDISGPYRMKALHTQEVRIPMPSRGICSAGDLCIWHFDGALHTMARRSPAAERHEPLPAGP